MPLTAVQKMAKRRAKARRDGKCPVCCTRDPVPGLTVCDICNEAAKIRVQNSRLEG